MKRQNRDAGGQLLKGEQGIPVEFLGNGRGGEWRHEVSATAYRVPTRSRAAKKLQDHLPTL